MRNPLQPANPNALHQLGGKLVLMRAPSVMFFCQDIVIPDVQLREATQYTPHDRIPHPGDMLYRGDLSVTFQIDEDMRNYSEIYDWKCGLGAPDGFDQYRALSGLPKLERLSGAGVFSDITVTIADSAFNSNVEFRFQDCWPSGLSGPRFSTRDNEPKMLVSEARFQFRHFVLARPKEE